MLPAVAQVDADHFLQDGSAAHVVLESLLELPDVLEGLVRAGEDAFVVGELAEGDLSLP